MTPYYEHAGITIYHGDCREALPQLDDESIDAIVTDPPYGEGLDFVGDDHPASAADLVAEMLRAVECRVLPGALLACFWTMRSLDYLMDGVRSTGWTYRRLLAMHVNGTARPDLGWLPRLQPVLIGQLGSKAKELHDRVAPYIASAIEQIGLSHGAIADALGCDSRLVMKWSRKDDPAWCLPTERFYDDLKSLVGLGDEFDSELAGRWRSKSNDLSDYHHDLYLVRGGRRCSDHPAEKPIGAMKWVCEGLPDGVILDPFMGSGSTLAAAKELRRRAIGIEIEERYCEIAAQRLSQEVLPLEHEPARKSVEALWPET